MEILDYRVLLPALINVKDAEPIFVYIDHVNKTVILPDPSVIPNSDDFCRKVYQYIQSRNAIISTPVIPKEGFSKLEPKNYPE